jgi:hypothetical protein
MVQGLGDCLGLGFLKLLGGWLVLRMGFTHVSDDDYARVVIAETFGHHPKLDPSGTSWLPLPFWELGSLMRVFGTTLEVARAVALFNSTVAVAAVYAALRWTGQSRWVALVGTAIPMLLPMQLWLGAATVPEAWTSALMACGLFLWDGPSGRSRGLGALALGAASLCRYEAWPLCLSFVLLQPFAPLHLRRRDKGESGPLGSVGTWRSFGLPVAIALAGPCSWMAWNAYDHGHPLHFLHRVARFRVAAGMAPSTLFERTLGYPRALLTTWPLLTGCAIASSIALCIHFPNARRRIGGWVVHCGSLVAFLVAGDLQNGAPTHHPERALVSLHWVMGALLAWCLFAVLPDLLTRAKAVRRPVLSVLGSSKVAGFMLATLLGCAAFVPWVAEVGRFPGQEPWARRNRQLTQGNELRDRGSPFALRPCAYEHFALLAAYGDPASIRILPASGKPFEDDGTCPEILSETALP